MAQIGSRRGAAPSMTPILMVLAFVAMAGFLYWLSMAAEERRVQVQEDGADTTEVDTGGSAPQVAMSTFRGDPAAHMGQRIRVTNVTVSSLLGQSGLLFWLAPDDNPYLVHRDSTVASGRQVRSGMRGSVTGTVHEMTDSVLDAWEAAGAFTSDADRFVAEFAENFLEADGIQLRESQSGGDAGSGGG